MLGHFILLVGDFFSMAEIYVNFWGSYPIGSGSQSHCYDIFAKFRINFIFDFET